MYCTSYEPNLHGYDSEKYYLDPALNSTVPFPSLHEEASVDLTVIVPAYNEEERCMDTVAFVILSLSAPCYVCQLLLLIVVDF